jgi:predicted porin
MNKYSMGALVAAGLLMGGLTAGSASAADFGGNCCADLEERIAELEATTARKGNRKVSLTISGWVAEQVVYWDDGDESNVYVSGLGATLDTHFKMTGQATISPGWTAGYVIHVEVNSSEPLLGQDQDNDDAAHILSGGQLHALQSFWFIKSDTYGKISVGRQSQASDNTAILVDGSGSLVPANWVVFEGAGFFLRDAGGLVGDGAGGSSIKGTATWNDLVNCLHGGVGGDCNGGTLEAVRYDSPTFGGFSVSASWGEDDFWDVAARYAGEFGGFKVAASAAYDETTDGFDELDYFQAGLYVQHVPTGLFAYGAYGLLDQNTAGTPDGETYYVKGGLRERWSPLGHTVLYGEYMNIQDQFTPGLDGGQVTGSEFELFGAGIVQEIDAAAMSLWVSYRHFEGEVSCTGGIVAGLCSAGNTASDIEDFDLVKAGALINF